MLSSNLEVVVFSGGEVTLLKDTLIDAITYCNSKGLKSRVVSNGSWAKTSKSASRFVRDARAAGLDELNISTGREHQEWVPLSSVQNAAYASVSAGISTIVTIESHANDRHEDGAYQSFWDMAAATPALMRVIRNSWMTFKSMPDYGDLGSVKPAPIETFGPCGQLFSNLVVTPYRQLSVCCGLTFEHMPDMKIGRLGGSNALESCYSDALDDFSKIWLAVDGPAMMLGKAMGEARAEELIGNSRHICEVCARMHNSEEAVAAVRAKYKEEARTVLHRFNLKTFEASFAVGSATRGES